jgi:hypothetical protein
MCYSCGAPLENPEFKGPTADLCKFCTDESGKLKSRAEVQAGVAHWLKMWQPGLDDAKAMRRADLYLQAMPAWAE